MRSGYVSPLTLMVGLLCAACQDRAPSPPQLRAVIQRDTAIFTAGTIPDPVIERLSRADVVIIGEVHRVREHQELVGRLVPALHARGFRQILLELAHADDWWLDAYVTDELPSLSPKPARQVSGRALAAIREFNQGLPAEERIHAHAIDVNHAGYGRAFVQSLGWLLPYLKSAELVQAFRDGYSVESETQIEQLTSFLERLKADEVSLSAAWGGRWHSALVEMVEVICT